MPSRAQRRPVCARPGTARARRVALACVGAGDRRRGSRPARNPRPADPLEHVGQRRRGLRLQRNGPVTDLDRVRVERPVQLQRGAEPFGFELRPRVVKPQKGGDRYLHPGRDVEARPVGTGDRGSRKGRSDAGAPVPIPQPLYLHVGDRDELGQPSVQPGELLGVERHLQLAKGERQDRGLEVTIAPVRRPEGCGEGAIVEVAGVPEPGIVRVRRRCFGRREQKGVGVEGRRKIVRPLLGALRVKEREFGEGEHLIRPPPPGHYLVVERPECRLGIIVEPIVQIGPVEDDLRESARFAGGEDVARQLTLGGLGIHLSDADRRGARADRAAPWRTDRSIPGPFGPGPGMTSGSYGKARAMRYCSFGIDRAG